MACPDWQRILGVRFFDGAAPEAVDYITRVGGYTVVPAAPALVKIENDPACRRALVEADLAIADSGFMVLLWRMLRGRTSARISGLKYLRILLSQDCRTVGLSHNDPQGRYKETCRYSECGARRRV